MAKAGMRRPDPKAPHGTESNKKTKIPKNTQSPVPEIQGSDRRGATPDGGVTLTTSEVLDFAEGADSY
jgi:hypothetical protein